MIEESVRRTRYDMSQNQKTVRCEKSTFERFVFELCVLTCQKEKKNILWLYRRFSESCTGIPFRTPLMLFQ